MQRLALTAALILSLTTTPASAGENPDPGTGRDAMPTSRSHDRGIFSSAERNLIRSWLLETARREATGQPQTALPTGLQQKATPGKQLPPGWEMKLIRGERLDHDYYNRGSTLPADLLQRLPPPPPGSEILRIEDRIIRLDAASRAILDVFALGGGY